MTNDGRSQSTVLVPVVAGLAGLLVGFFFCWWFMARPLMVQLDQREQSLREWERINRLERDAIATIKTISVEELRHWVSVVDEQNARFSQLQSRLHQQEIALLSPGTGHLVIAVVALIGVSGFMVWMMRDANADAARTLNNAVAVLPSLRASLVSRGDSLLTPADSSPALPISAPNETARRCGKVVRWDADRGQGRIAPDDGGPTVDFSEADVFASDGRVLQSSAAVTFVNGRDRNDRPCARDVRVATSVG